MTAAPEAPMIMRTALPGGFIRLNAAFGAAVGYTDRELAEKPFLDWINPEDRRAAIATLEGGQSRCTVRHRTRDGDWLSLSLESAHDGPTTILLGRCAPAEDPTPEEDDEISTTGRTDLETIARIVEDQNPGYKCSILLLSDGKFAQGAGPSLPHTYNEAIDGHAIGPTVGSCGTAIYWNTPIIAVDIQSDPLWAPFADLAREAGVAACWSHPFESANGTVLGALALYSPEPRAPTLEQLSRLRAAARMTGLAVDRGRAERALRKKRARELELEEQLRQAAKMEALGVLAGGVAHDFNNVLGGILANAELALDLVPADGDLAEMLNDIVGASIRAGGFCQQMLAYAGHGKLATAKVEVRTLLPQLSSLVQAALSKKATLQYSLLDEPVFVEGDENQLLQVVLNLVTNASEALRGREGRIVVGTSLAHYDREALESFAPDLDLPEGEYVQLTVSDDGCGMSEETAARVFDPFFTTKRTGRGLGLAAVRGIVRGHGGVIHVSSTPGEGTTVTVALPTVSSPNSRLPANTVRTSALPDSPRLVLLAEDEDKLRRILCRRLRHSGFEVAEAVDGQDAIEMFRAAPGSFDCVLLDLNMPKRSGDEVCQELRALRPEVPIILMSGLNEVGALERFEPPQIPIFLQKPVRAADLLAALEAAMN